VRHRISNLQVYGYPVAGAAVRLWWRLGQRGISYERRGPLFEYVRRGEPCIVALWHQDVFPLMFELFRYTASYPAMYMVSGGRIGRIGTYFLNLWNVECVAGSSAGHGIDAIEELARRAKVERKSVFLMADGSRGPARQARWGPVYLARDSGLPVIAARAWGDNLVVLRRTWMQLALPCPWGKAVVVSGEPIYVPHDADKTALDAARRTLETRLNDLGHQAEQVMRER